MLYNLPVVSGSAVPPSLDKAQLPAPASKYQNHHQQQPQHYRRSYHSNTKSSVRNPSISSLAQGGVIQPDGPSVAPPRPRHLPPDMPFDPADLAWRLKLVERKLLARERTHAAQAILRAAAAGAGGAPGAISTTESEAGTPYKHVPRHATSQFVLTTKTDAMRESYVRRPLSVAPAATENKKRSATRASKPPVQARRSNGMEATEIVSPVAAAVTAQQPAAKTLPATMTVDNENNTDKTDGASPRNPAVGTDRQPQQGRAVHHHVRNLSSESTASRGSFETDGKTRHSWLLLSSPFPQNGDGGRGALASRLSSGLTPAVRTRQQQQQQGITLPPPLPKSQSLMLAGKSSFRPDKDDHGDKQRHDSDKRECERGQRDGVETAAVINDHRVDWTQTDESVKRRSWRASQHFPTPKSPAKAKSPRLKKAENVFAIRGRLSALSLGNHLATRYQEGGEATQKGSGNADKAVSDGTQGYETREMTTALPLPSKDAESPGPISSSSTRNFFSRFKRF